VLIASELRVPTPTGTAAEQVEQVRSSVKDVKMELIDDRVPPT